MSTMSASAALLFHNILFRKKERERKMSEKCKHYILAANSIFDLNSKTSIFLRLIGSLSTQNCVVIISI